jgi:hypothetical protein
MADEKDAGSVGETETPTEPTLQELAQQEEEAQKAAAAEKEPEGAKDEAAETDQPEDQDTDDPKGIVKWFDEAHGHKEAVKHTDDASFFASVSELLKMVGRKSEAETLGQKVQEHFVDRPDDLLAFLNGPAPKPGVKQTGTAESEFDPSWVTTDDNGKVVPTPGAPSDAMQRWGVHQQKLQRFAANPDKYIQDAVAERLKEIEGLNQKTRQEIEHTQLMADVEAVCQRNRKTLYIEGDPEKGLTPQGEKALAFYEKYEDKIPDPVTRLELGCERALAGAPKPLPRKVPGKATHKPGVATQPPKQQDSLDRFEAHVKKYGEKASLAGLFQQIAEEEAATA